MTSSFWDSWKPGFLRAPAKAARRKRRRPLEFELPGLVDRPDIKIGQRVSALRRHPLSMELDANRLPAWTALLGEDDQRGFAADLAMLAVGASHRGQLLQAAGEMGVVGWLEPVLSWPRRFIVGPDEIDAEHTRSN